VRAKTCSAEININKHLKKLLRGTVLPITLYSHRQDDNNEVFAGKLVIIPVGFHFVVLDSACKISVVPVR
jgi:hypothetical protein